MTQLYWTYTTLSDTIDVTTLIPEDEECFGKNQVFFSGDLAVMFIQSLNDVPFRMQGYRIRPDQRQMVLSKGCGTTVMQLHRFNSSPPPIDMQTAMVTAAQFLGTFM